ncbi:MAG: VanW family protein [Lachnospiraceae bacterium]|nr:VanW family protein [Lachnospiraceae bacterium]
MPVYGKNIDIKIGGADVGIYNYDTSENPEAAENAETSGLMPNITYGESGTETDPLEGLDIDMTDTITDHIYAGDIDLSGMTYPQAESAINRYISSLSSSEIILAGVDDKTRTVTASELGISWDNPEILVEALKIGKSGNPVYRYKKVKDLAFEEKKYDIILSYDNDRIRSIVEEIAAEQDVKAIGPRVKRENGAFVIKEEGTAGITINVDSSVDEISKELADWTGGQEKIALDVEVDEPKGTVDDFANMKDILGTFTTSFSSSGSDRSGNVRNGTNLVNGTMLYPGEQFSMYKTVSPFTEENGYFLAGSYLNGIVVESLGGGICQVSSTLYNAVLRAELRVDERHNHSMIVNYVDLSSDAAIAGTSKDFKFTNTKDTPIYIEGYTTDDKHIVFNIYGEEDRPAGRSVGFESVEVSRTEAEGEKIVADSAQPVGTISSQSAHTGYVGELWKIVKQDGVETERTQINKSTYIMVPKTYTVGTAADDPAISQAVSSAIATGSIDVVKSVIAELQAAANAASLLPVPDATLLQPQEATPVAPENTAIPAENTVTDAAQPAEVAQ